MTDYTHMYSARARNAGTPRAAGVNYELTFTYGYPGVECLPNEAILEAAARALKTHGQGPLQYAGVSGSTAFVDTLLAKLARDQRIQAGRENLLVTSGSMQVLGLLSELLVDPGDTVVVEAPTFLGAIRVLRNCGTQVEGVPLDEHGLRTDALAVLLDKLQAEGRTPKYLYVIPNFQNPMGVTTTLERRIELIALARKHNTLIVEDDAYFDLRFKGAPLPTIYELAGRKGAVYMGTFSKILSPGMRIGWAVGEPELIGKLSTFKVDGTSPFATHIADEFCRDGGLERNIDFLRTAYSHRAEVMMDSLSEFMPEGVTWTNPDGGFFLWITLPGGLDSAALLAKTRQHGVDFLPGTTCFADGSGVHNIRMAFSYVPVDDIPRGIRIMAECIREALAATTAAA